MKASETIKKYYAQLEKKSLEEYELAKKAREKGIDPKDTVEIPLATGLGERVEGLVGPEGVAKDIDGLLKEKTREDTAIEIITRITQGVYGQTKEEEQAEQSVRTSLTLLTEGVVAAPIEGISGVKIEKNPDGSRHLTVEFAGPIRSAGGTGQALAVLVADHTRKKLGLQEYRPTETEIERYVEEINIYHNVVSRLQYKPTDDEVRKIVKNCAVCVSGSPTAREEVNIYKNMEKFPSNRIRGGMCLVIGEGIAQKAPRLVSYAKTFNLNWDWLHSIIKIEKAKPGKEKRSIGPKDKYLKDVVAGRPIIAYPSRKGGFRLRYGRGRNTGLMSKGIHPATMIILDKFPAIGTQFKIERPGKGMTVVPCDSIQGPVVRLKDKRVLSVENEEQAREINNQVEEILFLGDLLVSFGDFVKDSHPIIASPWTEEWWALELEEAGGKCEDAYKVSLEQAEELSSKHGVPLHPKYVFPYKDIDIEQLKQLISWLEKGKLGQGPEKRILEELLVPHHVEEDKIVIEEPYKKALYMTLSIGNTKDVIGRVGAQTAMELVEELSPYKIKEKAPVYVGARMGRPEKAKERLMRPAPHLLFPVGNYGGPTRSLNKASEKGMLSLELPRLKCPKCKKMIFSWKCECGEKAVLDSVCSSCGRPTKDTCPACGGHPISYDKRAVNLKELILAARAKTKENTVDMKGVKGTISANKIFEPIEKGLLRSRNDLHVFKDGTMRFDSTNLVLTHFRPKEIGASVEKLKALGYERDIHGKPFEKEDQVLELFPQDVVPSTNAIKFFLDAGNFLDQELKILYGIKPYFNFEKKEDLIGTMIVGLAPHTSAGVLGRIIGFSKAHGCYAHPYFHAACRRDCFAYEETLPIFDGQEWNIVKLGEFTEKLLKEGKTRKTEFGDLVVETNGYKTLSKNQNGKYELKNITAFSKHPVHDHIVRLTAKTGRKITTSGLHPFTNKEKKPAFETTTVLIPDKIKIPEKDVEEIDLLDYADENTMIVGMEKQFKAYLKHNGLKNTAKKLGINQKTLFNYKTRNSIPLEVIKKLSIPIPKTIKLKTRWDTKVIPRTIKVDKNFLRILGLYVAEGQYRKKDKSFYQVSFAVIKQQDTVKKAIKKVFGIEPHQEKESLTISSRIIHNLFQKLKCGRTAKQKRVPPFILSLPIEKTKWFLQGYFEGGGGISQPNKKDISPEVNCTSASKMLLKDIEFLLTRFGINCSWQKDHRTMSTGKVAEKYSKKGKTLEWTCYKLRVYGKSVKDFCEGINFWWPEKRKKADEINQKHNFKPKRHEKTGDNILAPIIKKELIKKPQHLYNFTVKDNHNAIVSGINADQCDGDEDSIMLLMDALVNFSKQYLPATRGGKMDACLVLTTILDPSQVDDQVHRMDIVSQMPLEFYRESNKLLDPSDFKVELVQERLGTEKQYDGLGFTHDTTRIDDGVIQSSYTTLGAMEEKVGVQLGLGKKIRAVDEKDEAKRLLNSHFLRDIYGNLRAAGEQKFRCTKCNTKYRRPPLIGKCTRCGGRVILTVSEGSVRKYLEVSKKIAEENGLSDYMIQRLNLVEKNIDSFFKNDKVKNPSLTEFM